MSGIGMSEDELETSVELANKILAVMGRNPGKVATFAFSLIETLAQVLKDTEKEKLRVLIDLLVRRLYLQWDK